MFSNRTRFATDLNPLAEAHSRRLAAGKPVLDLTESNPTAVGLGFPEKELLAALAQPGAGRYQPLPFGLLEAREAVADYCRARGAAAPAGRIAITSSTSEAYSFLFKLLCDPGDQVLVPQPSYPLFDYLAGLESVQTAGYPLRYDGEWHIDRQGFESALGARTRAVVVVSPNNPTGSYLKNDELEWLDGLCASREVALLSDEVFGDYSFSEDPRRVETMVGATRALSFALSGMSKVAALPQLKIGWLVAGGAEPLVDEALKRLEVIADTFLSPNIPAQLSLGRLLSRRALAQEPIRARLRRNLDFLAALHHPGSSWQPLNCEGGWSAIVQLPRARSELEWALGLLEEDGVLVHPGFYFDFPGEAFVSLSLMVEPEMFREGASRLVRRVDGG